MPSLTFLVEKLPLHVWCMLIVQPVIKFDVGEVNDKEAFKKAIANGIARALAVVKLAQAVDKVVERIFEGEKVSMRNILSELKVKKDTLLTDILSAYGLAQARMARLLGKDYLESILDYIEGMRRKLEEGMEQQK